MNIANDIMEFISKTSKIPKNEMNMETEVYNSGIISSLSIMELMSYIEEQYRIIINPEDLIECNFKDIKTIEDFVQSKLKDI